jgi:Rod binding domain-containing protein
MASSISLIIPSRPVAKPVTTLDDAQSMRKKPTLEQAAKGFEAMLFQTMLKEMHNAKLADGLLESENEGAFRSMLDRSYADLAAKRMDLGLSSAITRSFSGVQPRKTGV